MTPDTTSPRSVPDQPAANSGGAVGFVAGGLAGIALALAATVEPWLTAYATPLQSVLGGCAFGTFCGVVVGGLRDQFGPKP